MTSRFALIAVAIVSIAGSVVACSAPSVEGDPLDNAPPNRSSRGKDPKGTKSAEVDENDVDPTDQRGTTTSPQTTPAPATTTTTTTTTTTPATDAGTTPPTPPPPPPPVQQPTCGGTAIQCYDCCLNANPAAGAFETEYGACEDECSALGGSNACYNECQRRHVTACAGNAGCANHHKCMEANNCLAKNYCDPI